MTTAYWCVLAAGLMPYLWVTVAKALGKRYDNADPRGWAERQQGLARRAHAAHLNSFEAFPLFAAAVLIAQQSAVDSERTALWALAFIGFRVAYGVCYLADQASLRSLMWAGGIGSVVAIFLGAA